jgi:hypothetical protein
MLFAPFGMPSGSALAAAPDHGRMQMADGGHCSGQPSEEQGTDQSRATCCTAMCAAIADAPLGAAEPAAHKRLAEQPALEQLGRSFLAKLPTPPPRLS